MMFKTKIIGNNYWPFEFQNTTDVGYLNFKTQLCWL